MLALTGANHKAQALACELVLVHAKRAGVKIFVAPGFDCPEEIEALRTRGHLVEVWRIGADPDRPSLDHLVDAHLTDDAAALPAAIEQQLLAFTFKAATQPATTHQEPSP
jgi:hypothetical protein